MGRIINVNFIFSPIHSSLVNIKATVVETEKNYEGAQKEQIIFLGGRVVPHNISERKRQHMLPTSNAIFISPTEYFCAKLVIFGEMTVAFTRFLSLLLCSKHVFQSNCIDASCGLGIFCR